VVPRKPGGLREFQGSPRDWLGLALAAVLGLGVWLAVRIPGIAPALPAPIPSPFEPCPGMAVLEVDVSRAADGIAAARATWLEVAREAEGLGLALVAGAAREALDRLGR